jgi:hypothetical protein
MSALDLNESLVTLVSTRDWTDAEKGLPSINNLSPPSYGIKI